MARWMFTALILALPAPARQEGEARKKAEALLQKLDSDVPAERDAAAEALIAGGDDFEKHIEKAAEDGKPEVRARCQDILKRIEVGRKRRDSWSPCKPITLALRDVPLKDAVDRLCRASGADIKMGTANPKARVTLALDSASFLVALEACCRSAGVWYKRTGQTLELVREKPPPASRCPAGPFTLGLSLAKSKPGEPVALQLDLEWDPGVKPRWFDVEIDSGTDDKGGSVLPVPVKEGRPFTELSLTTRYLNMPKEGESKDWAFDVLEVSPLSKGATRISSLKGKIRFYFPEEIQKVRFENPAKGDKRQLGVITATLDDFGYAQLPKGWGASLELNTFRTQREKRSALFAMLLTSKMLFFDKGNKAHATTYSGSGSAGHVTDPLQRMSVHACSERFGEKEPPQAVEMNVVTDLWEQAYPFEFKDVPTSK